MYACGLVLFEIATLAYPYTEPALGTSVDDFRRMHVLQQPAFARTKRPDLPQRFADVVQRLLSKRPQDRYRTWTEVRSGLAASQGIGPNLIAGREDHGGARQRTTPATGRRIAAEAAAQEARERAEVDRMHATPRAAARGRARQRADAGPRHPRG